MAENKFVDIDVFTSFIGVDKKDKEILFYIYLNAAQEVVETYLGFKLEEKEYTHKIKSSDCEKIALKAYPVKNFNSAVSSVFAIDKNIVVFENNLNKQSFEVSYTAGFTNETVPSIIKLTIMRIAAIMVSEENGNIAITGKSFGVDGGRTFISTRNYEPFLKELSTFRII